MSLIRAVLAVVQAVANSSVCSPPHPTSQKQRYHTDQMYILRIAPAVFKYHTLIAYFCALFEVLYYLRSTFMASMIGPSSTLSMIGNPSSTVSTIICPVQSTALKASPLIRPTPAFLLGVVMVVLGAFIRQGCFKTLGPLFTFELTVQPNHRLITRGFYAYVRHPSYTGAIFLVMGLAFSHLTRGSWMTECGPLAWTRAALPLIGGDVLRVAFWSFWWVWMLCVGISRADAEDEQMKRLFNEEWEAYAHLVPWWFMPGLI